MQARHMRTAAGVAAALALTAGTGRGLVLTFDPIAINGAPIDQAYGDRVATTPQSGLMYDTEGGFTPNVVVDYGFLPFAAPSLWRNGYGDLVNVLFDAQPSYGRIDIRMTADEGWNVALSGFDLATWAAVDPIRSLRIYTSTGDVLLSESDVEISADSHTEYRFDPPLTGQWISIAFDSGNLAGGSEYVGIDNIAFSQLPVVVPVEHVSWGALKARHR